MNERISRETIHMLTAILWSTRAMCKRPDRSVGCVITTNDLKRICSIAYNGPPKELPNDSCKGKDVVGDCGCLHAEANAIAKVDYTIPDKILFVTLSPCKWCAGLITQANISEVYFTRAYRNTDGIILLNRCGIKVSQLLIPTTIQPILEQAILRNSDARD